MEVTGNKTITKTNAGRTLAAFPVFLNVPGKRLGVCRSDHLCTSVSKTRNASLMPLPVGSQLIHTEPSIEKITSACRWAVIHDVIEKFPNGYQTQLDENSVGLSGG